MEILWHEYYTIGKVSTVEDLKAFFPDGLADEYNWLVASTSGVHGSYTTLNDWDVEIEECGEFRIAVLVIQPRLVNVFYGDILLETVEEAQWLRGLIDSTLIEIAKSQIGNTSASPTDGTTL